MNNCNICGRIFTVSKNLRCHIRTVHGSSPYQCPACPNKYSRNHDLRRHQKETHPQIYECQACGKKFTDKIHHTNHVVSRTCDTSTSHPSTSAAASFRSYQSAFKCRLQTYVADGTEKDKDIISFFTDLVGEIKTILQNHLKEHRAIKFNLVLNCEYGNKVDDSIEHQFALPNRPVFVSTDLDELLDESRQKLLKMEEDKNMGQSGWALKKILYMELRVNKYEPVRGSSYLPLPLTILAKKACVNVKNTRDQKCFFYSMLAKFLPKTRGIRITPDMFQDIVSPYNFDDIEYPAQLKDVKTFTRKNPDCSVNVYGLTEENHVYPLHVTDCEKNDHTDLLLYSDDATTHWVWIKNLSRLIRAQMSKHHEEKLICRRCFKTYGNRGNDSSNEMLAQHEVLCSAKPLTGVKMPSEDRKFIEFTNVDRQLPLPICIYADLECVLQPVSTCAPGGSYTNPLHLHRPVLIGAYVQVDEVLPQEIKNLFPSGVQIFTSIPDFVQFLRKTTKTAMEVYTRDAPIVWGPGDKERFDASHDCYLCAKPLCEDKCADHCHISGRFRGAAHNRCNLACRYLTQVPCYFHNLTNYDSHFLIRDLAFDTEEIQVIPNSTEKFVAFSKVMGHVQRGKKNVPFKVTFVDTYRLMPASLEKLASLMKPQEFQITRREFPHHAELVTKKGVMCYEYLTSEAVLDETCLPPKEKFYSSLNGEDITDEEYQRAHQVWSTFQCCTIRDYVRIYLKSDVLILADVFQAFRKLCLQTYKVDAAHYLTQPSLAWDAMLKVTGVRLELLTDYDMLMFVENVIRGGLTVCPHRYAEANNKHLDNYDASKPSSYIISLDANNLYGWAMSQPLPLSGFQWVERPEEITLEFLQNLPDSEGYYLEVDVRVPQELHDKFNDFPFLPENRVPPGGKHSKLMATLFDKKNYFAHHATLRQALEHGLVLEKVHRALRFQQSTWLKSYIDLNTAMRTKATNDFEKDQYKLMNNAVFGKTMENVRNRLNFRLVCNPDSLRRLICKPGFQDRIIYSENLVGVTCRREIVHFNRPIYAGAAILELAKPVNYQFHYDVLQPFFKNKLRLLYQDTDSLAYWVESEDIFEDFKRLLDHLDTSDYPPDHPLFSLQNKKVLGKWKDELGGRVVICFVGLRAKMYAFRIQGQEAKKKAKGVKRQVVCRDIEFEDYISVLREGTEMYHKQTYIRSLQHNVKTVEVRKKTLSPHDDKRHILNDGISTLAHGHWKIGRESV